ESTPDVADEFKNLFNLKERRRRPGEAVVLDYDEDIRKDSELLVGREEELRQVKDTVKGCGGGGLWLTGAGGIGKRCLVARLAHSLGNDPRRWCVIAWRFRASDGDRCHRHAFFRHAIRRLASWEPLGQPGVVPTAESHKLEEQLSGLLDAVAKLQP